MILKPVPHWFRWLGALAWTIVTLVLMLSPTVTLPSTFLGDLTDKAAHFGTFGLLAVLWYSVLVSYYPRPQALRLTIGLALIFGAFTELMQGMVPGRSTDLFDFLANVLGIGAGTTVVYWAQRWRFRALRD